MGVIDVFTSYVAAGAGAMVGLGLVSLIRTDQPRLRQALGLYRWAFGCIAVLGGLPLLPPESQQGYLKFAIGSVAMGVALLAWAFRQLNGRRTAPWGGMVLTGLAGASIWGAAWWGDAVFAHAIALVFAVLSVGMTLEQGWIILRSPKVSGSELSLLWVASGFALNWLVALQHVMAVPGPYPAHWLHVPTWLLPWSGLAIALLPLSVAAVVFAIVNERLNGQLRARALADDLTGTLSRRGLRELGERMLGLQHQPARATAVLMIDVDHFKDVNDRHGHQVGDEVLRHLAQLLRDHLREDALLARYGGEEFTVLLPVRMESEALRVAERLRRVVEASPCRVHGAVVHLTVSVGVAFHRRGQTLEQDLARADASLYEAKRQGRNRVMVAPTASP
ncbi:MAG: GGDEF domain-containing protein [Aquabacterium sp.]